MAFIWDPIKDKFKGKIRVNFMVLHRKSPDLGNF